MKKASLIALILTCAVALTSCSATTYEKTKINHYVTLGTYKGISYKSTSTDVTDYDLTCAVQKAMASAGYGTESTDQITEGKVQVGDTLNIDFTGYKEGQAFEGGTATGYELTIGSGSFIEGFEEGLVNVSVGDQVNLNVTFPDNYGSEELQGADVVFAVTVNFIKTRKNYPALTDEMAAALDPNAKTADEYLANEKASLKASSESSAESTVKSDVWNQVISNCTFSEKLPSALSKKAQTEFTNYYTAVASKAGYSDLSSWLTANNLTDATFQEKAESYGQSMVKSQLTAYAIAKAEGYKVTDEILNEQAGTYASSAGYSTADEYIKAVGKDAIKDQIILDYATGVAVENAVANA